jgi:hypothetical protein
LAVAAVNEQVDRDDGQTDWVQFTVSTYCELLGLAKKTYRFASYLDGLQDRHVLWRHDVDFSVHRALRLAEIEHDFGVRATYFFMLRSEFYNLLEEPVLTRARRIVGLGHYLGLHFVPDTDASSGELEAQAARERDLLSYLLATNISALSVHNPMSLSSAAELTADQIAGMVNAYGKNLAASYTYCSDSNGYWRHRRLVDILTTDAPDRLHVLTHPAWWTETPMPPRQRVEQAVMGRATAVLRNYDEMLKMHGRRNIR